MATSQSTHHPRRSICAGRLRRAFGTPLRKLRGVLAGRAARIIGTVAAALCCGAAASVGVYASLRTGQVDASQVTATVVEPAMPGRSQPAIGQWTTPQGPSASE